MGGQLAQEVQRELEAETPLSALRQRRRWRELRMARLAKLKRDLDQREQRKAEDSKLVPLPTDN